MPMDNSDYFNEYLEKDWKALDRELSSDRWFNEQTKDLRDGEPDMGVDVVTEEEEQQHLEQEKPEYRDTFDRRERQKETREERIQRIKDEYNQRPMMFVGAAVLDDRIRRQERKRILERMEERANKDKPKFDEKYPQNTQQDPAMEGMSANSPNFTQLVGGSIRSFCRIKK